MPAAQWYWYVMIGDAAGNPLIDPITRRPKLIVMPDAKFADGTAAMEHVRGHYRNVCPIRAWQTDQPPDARATHRIPERWFELGTNRMHREIELGLRPYSEFLEPPLEPRKPRIIVPMRGATFTPIRKPYCPK